MTETIEVVYKPIVTVGPKTIYHKYIIYTDSFEQEWYARGGPAVGDGYESRGGDPSSQSYAEPNGNIVTERGQYLDGTADWIDPEVDDRHRETIATDGDLSSYWSGIVNALDDIMAQNHTYQAGNNSNSTIDTVLERAGLSEPQDDNWGEYWSPGSANALPDSVQSDPDAIRGTGEWVGSVAVEFGLAVVNASPLVFDLSDNDAIDLISLANSEAYWNNNENDFRSVSGWVDSDDGLLAIDLNDNGVIDDNGELFGTADTDGFSILAEHDTNHDGEITEEDAVWADLILWQDHNENGISEDGELYGMSDFDVVSIDLDATEVSQTNEGHDVTHTSTFTVDDGVNPPDTRIVHDVWFEYDTVNTVYDQEYTIDEAVLYMADVRGYGKLPDLWVSMSLDNDGGGNLRDLVLGFTLTDLDEIVADDSTAMDDVADIMYRWAEVDGVASDSRGPNIDARQLEFLEALMGQPFRQTGSVGQSDPAFWAGLNLEEAFHIAQQNIYARLVAQSAGADLFEGDVYYDVSSDSLEGVTGLNQSTIDTLETQGMSETYPEVFWANVVRVIEYTVGVSSLSGGDQTYLDDAIYATDNSLTLSEIVDSLDFSAPDGSTYNGTSGNDTLTGGTGYDTLNGDDGDDTLEGGIGNDTLNGGNDDDELWGESGQDYLRGSTGEDNYHWEAGHGHDVIREAGTGAGNTNDRIVLGSGFDSGDLTITRVSNTGMLIEIDNGSQTGSILIEKQFNYNVGEGNVEYIEFDDTSTYDLINQDYTLTGTDEGETLYGAADTSASGSDTIYGGGGNDTIYGYAPNAADSEDNWLYGEDGNDYLNAKHGDDHLFGGNGNDTLIAQGGSNELSGGTGNDTVSGATNVDTYIYTSGHDVYSDAGGTDELHLVAAWDSITPEYLKVGNDLIIEWDSNNSITIDNHFGGDAIESMIYDDTTNVDLTSVSYTVQGTSGNDTLVGTAAADTLYGYEGDDNIRGQNGNDVLYGGIGDDWLRGENNDDYLDGGAGDDLVEGAGGNDHYFYVSGHDEFRDTFNTDIVELAEGWAWEELTFRRYSDAPNDMVIEINGSNSITLWKEFSTSQYQIETLRMNDGTGDVALVNGAAFESHGTSGNDTFFNGVANGHDQDDVMYGWAGNDDINGQTGNDTLYGGEGNDDLNGGNDNDILYGEEGDDILTGGSGNDTFYYSEGMDEIYESSGTDTLHITGGVTVNDISFSDVGTNDTAVVINSSVDEVLIDKLRYWNTNFHVETIKFDDGFEADLPSYASWDNGTASGETVTGDGSDNVLVGFAGGDTLEAGAGADAAHGGDGDDTIEGDAGDDLLYGGADDDTLIGGTGDDIMDGGDGTDTADYSNDGGGVTVDLDAGTATDGNSDSDTLRYIENVIGSAYADTIDGDAGNNTIEGGAGADDIDGAAGSDTLVGGTGNDTLNGGDGIDTVDYSGDGSGVTVNLYTGSATDGNSDTDTLSNLENVIGSDYVDTIDGDAGANELWGGAGNDGIDGGDGNDTLIGGTGDDDLDGEGGSDWVSYYYDSAGVTVNLGTGFATDGNADTDTLSNIENVVGSTHNDTITGDANANSLNGQAGSDTLNGAAGNDYLYGGAGVDTLNGGDDNDTLYGAAGDDELHGNDDDDYLNGGDDDDTLYGEDGLDTLVGGAGADTFVFEDVTAFNDQDIVSDFNTGDGDVIDIADILDSYYTYGVDTLTDFVQITDDGTDSTLSIDQDGGADNFVAVASILGVTGLTDEAGLETSGALVTH